jgi:bifunctional DNA-binding transcriptional regulator/antitoxin component of YhaV-PrlF toxin-antitoxin module
MKTTIHLLHVGAKGRTVIPAALRAEIRVGEGDELVGRAENGRLILETHEAIKARLRAEAKAARRDGQAVDRLLSDRTADLRLEEERRHPPRRSESTSA